jgi:biopolymer transport protein ExbB/TolQ
VNTTQLMSLPLFEAEWVLWLLIGLSAASIAIAFERWVFLFRRRVDLDELRGELSQLLENGQIARAAELLARHDALETNVVLFGLRAHHKGPDAVEHLIEGATEHERLRYGRRLGFLATVGSNAPFVGLFGTVLGIIRAFADLSGDLSQASGSVMSGISEALIATAVGLLVAVPAVVAYNVLSARVSAAVAGASTLAKVLLSELDSQATREVA